TQPSSQLAQLSRWRVLHGEQIGDELTRQLMSPHLLRRDLLSLTQRRDSLTDLAALSLSPSHVDQHPGASLGGQPGGVHTRRSAEGAARGAQFDGDGDFIQSHVGRAELSVVVVAPFTDPRGNLSGPFQI